MIDSAMISNPGGRSNNEDYVTMAVHGNDKCFVLCDGLGGHECGEVASACVADNIAAMFEERGDSPGFLEDALQMAQERLIHLQQERNMEDAMKTTAVVLVITETQIKWAHIGDSRLYHFFDGGAKYERTRDHSMVQVLCDMGEITEREMRNHPERNKILRVMGAEWGTKSFDLSAILECEPGHAFALMTDGFWEYVQEEEMMHLLRETDSAEAWMREMEKLVRERADLTQTDNYSAICVKIV